MGMSGAVGQEGCRHGLDWTVEGRDGVYTELRLNLAMLVAA